MLMAFGWFFFPNAEKENIRRGQSNEQCTNESQTTFFFYPTNLTKNSQDCLYMLLTCWCGTNKIARPYVNRGHKAKYWQWRGEKQSSYTKQDVNMSVGQPAASSIHSHSNGRYDIILPNGRQRGRVRENRIDRNIIKNVDKVIQVPSNCPSSWFDSSGKPRVLPAPWHFSMLRARNAALVAEPAYRQTTSSLPYQMSRGSLTAAGAPEKPVRLLPLFRQLPLPKIR